jgi:hypothetical protein
MARIACSRVAEREIGALPPEFSFYSQLRTLSRSRCTPYRNLSKTVTQVKLNDTQIQQCDAVLKFAQDRKTWSVDSVASTDSGFFKLALPTQKNYCLSVISSIYTDEQNRTPSLYINKMIPSVPSFYSKTVGLRPHKDSDRDDSSIVTVVVGLSCEFVGGSLVIARNGNFISQSHGRKNDFLQSSIASKSKISIKMCRGTAVILFNQPEHMVTKVNLGSRYTLVAIFE